MAERYEFQNKEGTSGIILAPDFIALHTSKYDTGEHFVDTLQTALNIVHEVVQFSLAERVDTHGLTPVALAKEVCIYLEGCMPSNSL